MKESLFMPVVCILFGIALLVEVLFTPGDQLVGSLVSGGLVGGGLCRLIWGD